ncbi:hypothetical protein E3U55_12435 [Filobacillus milosensis]|uniref:Spore coat protein CotO n=1 Tax=Filobacillus milosensis TaxID=94137 RepID=A0A4Y8IHL7_9BACI|nr:CotO family spore coat protein [Filobacillus milosensis]TFB15053.1 hypothetical protein E3U55_12435 [Filobacillus milosensis]
MEDQRTKPPLLYIAQNKESHPQVETQSSYYTANTQKQQKTEVEQAKAASRSRFQSLSVEGKLNYITNMQETLPKLKCKFLTKEGAFNGHIEEVVEEGAKVFLTDLRRRRTLTNDILLDIQIIGF